MATSSAEIRLGIAENPLYKRFSFICSFQVLEHVYEVYGFLNSAIALLKNKGKLIIAVPNNNPYFLKHDKYHTLNLPPHHMGIWDERSLKFIGKLFDEIGPNF